MGFKFFLTMISFSLIVLVFFNGCSKTASLADNSTTTEKSTIAPEKLLKANPADDTTYIGNVLDEKISVAQYKVFLATVISDMEGQYDVKPDEESRKAFWTAKLPNGDDPVVITKNAALERVRQFTLFKIIARENKFANDPNDIQKVFKAIDDDIKKNGKDNVEQKSLALNGVSVDEYKKLLPDIILASITLPREWKAKIKPTNNELVEYYNKNKERYKLITLNSILFATVDKNNKPLSDDKIKKAQNDASVMGQRVHNGEDIAKLAKEYSQDPDVKKNGSEYSSDKGNLDSGLEAFASNIDVGGVGMLRTGKGFNVFKVKDIKYSFEKRKDRVLSDYINEMYKNEEQKWWTDKKYDWVNKDQKIIDSVTIPFCNQKGTH